MHRPYTRKARIIGFFAYKIKEIPYHSHVNSPESA